VRSRLVAHRQLGTSQRGLHSGFGGQSRAVAESASASQPLPAAWIPFAKRYRRREPGGNTIGRWRNMGTRTGVGADGCGVQRQRGRVLRQIKLHCCKPKVPFIAKTDPAYARDPKCLAACATRTFHSLFPPMKAGRFFRSCAKNISRLIEGQARRGPGRSGPRLHGGRTGCIRNGFGAQPCGRAGCSAATHGSRTRDAYSSGECFSNKDMAKRLFVF